MNKKIFASLLLTVFALGFTGCSEEQSSNSKAETKETQASVSVTEVENIDDETEIIKTTPQNPNNVVKEIDNNDYSIGLLLTGWNTSISSISEIDPSLDSVFAVNNTTNHFDSTTNNILTTDESGKMIYKKHIVSNVVSLYSKEDEKDKVIQKIISEYELPSEYTTQEYPIETNLQFGYIEKYDGDVSISLSNNSTVIVVTNTKK